MGDIGSWGVAPAALEVSLPRGQAAAQHQQVEQSSLLAAKVQLHRVVVCLFRLPNAGDVGSSGFLLFSSGIAIGGNSGMLSFVQAPPPMAGAVPSASPLQAVGLW